ncbi:hypothetical protein BpHYR1_040734 [Brachionus plicatilis]|uniref:Uncharacterized protein n=1 Tax=Brachionus plicatilis TaxID=10195 RepID=A0A3M7RQZ4_BRAPC|nr:hypothetical protein BpHYR1_040734 [Brachionus plicatilis]
MKRSYQHFFLSLLLNKGICRSIGNKSRDALLPYKNRTLFLNQLGGNCYKEMKKDCEYWNKTDILFVNRLNNSNRNLIGVVYIIKCNKLKQHDDIKLFVIVISMTIVYNPSYF